MLADSAADDDAPPPAPAYVSPARSPVYAEVLAASRPLPPAPAPLEPPPPPDFDPVVRSWQRDYPVVPAAVRLPDPPPVPWTTPPDPPQTPEADSRLTVVPLRPEPLPPPPSIPAGIGPQLPFATALPADQPVRVPLTLRPVVALNRLLELPFRLTGPLGSWLVRPAGRHLLGWAGVLLLLGSAGWGATLWFGLEWPG